MSDTPKPQEAADGGCPPATCSAWPDAPGYYWWRGAPSFRWEMMQVLAYGAEDDQSRYMTQKVEARQGMRSLQVWKERGEWVKIRQPETPEERSARHLREHVCAMNRDMMGTCLVCGSSSMPNVQAHSRRRSDAEIETTPLPPSSGAPCSESSLPFLVNECCLSTSGKAEEGFTIGMLKERLAMVPEEWNDRYLTIQEVWNDDEKMRDMIPPERYREKGTLCGLGFFAHGGGSKNSILTGRILESGETDALLSSSQNTSPLDATSDP